MQSEMMEFILTKTEASFVCSAPTGSGKTVLLELAMLAGLFQTTTTTNGARRRRGDEGIGSNRRGCNNKVVYFGAVKSARGGKAERLAKSIRSRDGVRFKFRFVDRRRGRREGAIERVLERSR